MVFPVYEIESEVRSTVYRVVAAFCAGLLMLSVLTMLGDREKSLANGMNDHVAKPIDPNELFTTLEKWILPAENREPVQMDRKFTELQNALDEALTSCRTLICYLMLGIFFI
jgi:DNA-binding response OmpR family regulator